MAAQAHHGVIGALVPSAVSTVATRSELGRTALFAEEARALGDAVKARRVEFATGRACARRALQRLSLPAGPVGAGAHGEPLWPAGVVGSITHCPGLRACCVARTADVQAIGIDAEPDAPLPGGVLAAIADAGERAALAGVAPNADRLLFSAKESVYKAWFALTGASLRFEDADVRLDADGTFIARLRADGPLAQLDGRWGVADGLLATAVVVTP